MMFMITVRNIFSCLQNVKTIASLKPSTRNTHTKNWTSKAVQETFVNYFVEREHTLVKSSSVLPWNDASLAFVNAGMNQFKSVLLGKSAPPCPRAVNSQKCIRLGGKHNDLAAVGHDTYHHTFFEMLGSWSFGDYFKRDACTMAWHLLTDVYKLPAHRLYVTYFGGDDSLGLPPDIETRDIWRDIGVAHDRILPFGMADNFWEMGAIGPCGPCTEIHYSRHADDALPGHGVNEGRESVIELWNLVFVQYERLPDGSINSLSRHHVDTGMGLERLTAVLNGVSSNYDTDLFLPLFDAIQQVSGAAAYSGSFTGPSAALDTDYRILADHARMAVVALADNCLPNNSNSLRKVLQRLYSTARHTFHLTPEQDWLGPVSECVAASLGGRYPEVRQRQAVVQAVLRHELLHHTAASDALRPMWDRLVKTEPVLSSLQHHASQGLVQGLAQLLPDIRQHGLSPSAAVRLTSNWGVGLEALQDLSQLYSCPLDLPEYERLREQHKREARARVGGTAGGGSFWRGYCLDDFAKLLAARQVRTTDRESVYSYYTVTDQSMLNGDDLSQTTSNALLHDKIPPNATASCSNDILYVYEPVNTIVVALISGGKLVDRIDGDDGNVGVVLKDSSFYSAAGGQISDKGLIRLMTQRASGDVINVQEAEEISGYVIHWGSIVRDNTSIGTSEDEALSVGSRVTCSIDPDHRLACSRHHTATHLLHASLQHLAESPIQQVSSHVSHNELQFEVATYGPLTTEHILSAEQLVQDSIIMGGSSVMRRQLPLQEALQLPHVSLLSGAVYPDLVTMVDCGSLSRLQDNDCSEINSCNSIDKNSCELCCGTHLLHTAHLEDFVITFVGSSGGAGVREMRAVCGRAAQEVRHRGESVLLEISSRLNEGLLMEDGEAAQKLYGDWVKSLIERETLPHRVKAALHASVQTFPDNRRLAITNRTQQASEELLSELEAVHRSYPHGAVVHSLSHPHAAAKRVLRGAYNIFGDRTFLVLLRVGNNVRARAVVDQSLMDSGASALQWMNLLLSSFPGGVVKPGTNPHSLATFSADLVSPISPEQHRLLLHTCNEYIQHYN